MKDLRRFALFSAAAIAVVSALSGCALTAGSSSGSSGSGGAQAAPIDFGPYCGQDCKAALTLKASQDSINCKVAFLDDATSFPYGAAQFSLASQDAKKYFPNMDLTVQNGNNDPATQSSQLDTVVAQGTKVVVLDPVVAGALAPAVQRATAQGVKVIAMDRTTTAPVLTTIKAPDIPLATRTAQYIADQLHGQGTVAILSGTPGASPTIDRTNGFMQVMQKYPGIKIVADVNGNYDTADGNTAVTNLLTKYPKGSLNFIFSEADAMSLGAIKAIAAADRQGDVKLAGIDGQNEGFQAIKDGTYAATTVYPLVMPMGVVAAAKACANESMPASIPLEYPLVTQANVDQYLGTTYN
ncbi:MAG: ribose transport system substrate-binding protein [Pseudonocardiales bacterium]|jgi:ribose transport system substrate-binding protein|nr:ribose transport system substrate-binding protein [Pseudonocardiales bacterium]